MDAVILTDATAELPTAAPNAAGCPALDPRIRRTRELLQQALANLLETKEFDKISVHDITDAATLNRATFYAHYPDKFALLECMVAARFQALLDARGVVFDGTCQGALRGIILGVCDFVAGSPGQGNDRQMQPHMESAVVAVVRRMLLVGLRQQHRGGVSPEMLASAASWAIFGAAREWSQTPGRLPSEQIADTVASLIVPMLH